MKIASLLLRGSIVVFGVAGVLSVGMAQLERAVEPDSPMAIEPSLKEIEGKPGVPTSGKTAFDLLDANGDGRIDRSEWKARQMAVFFIRDDNRDLQLGRDELPAVGQDAFAAADLNHDGSLSGYEFNQAKLSAFDAADINQDGGVSFDEFSTFLATLRK